MKSSYKLMLSMALSILPSVGILAAINSTPEIKKMAISESSSSQTEPENAVEARTQGEDAAIINPYVISFYKPSYILPFYYAQQPNYGVYQNTTPDHQPLNKTELKFQFSFKVPAWTIDKNNHLYLAYSQQSYWQSYVNSAYFLETNYEPEVFLEHNANYPLFWGWNTTFINPGLVHQSNGQGGSMERSWNRAYINAIAAKGNWMVSVEPWYVFRDHSMDTYNPNITHYMGHGEVWVSYKVADTVISLMSRNDVDSLFSRGSEEMDVSFPLNTHFKAYIQLFSGYGQSLINYNHYTNAIGIGFSLNDWI